MYNEDNNEYQTDDPYVEYLWEKQGISLLGTDFKRSDYGSGEQIEIDTFEHF